MRTYFQLRGGRLEEVKGEVVREQPLTVYIDGERFLTLLCSPFQLEPLVLGYLWMEKVITGLHEVTSSRISEVDGPADVTLTHPVILPTERILTSRTSPTEMAVALAEQLGITVVGYVRGESFNLYAGDVIDLPGTA